MIAICPRCRTDKNMICDSEASYEEYGCEGDGVVVFCHCTGCGCEAEYFLPDENQYEEGETKADARP